MKNKSKYPPLDLAAPVIFALVFIMTFTYSQLEPNVQDVDSSYVKEHKDLKGYLLVDAREDEVYNGKSPRRGIPGGHIPGAVNFSIYELQDKNLLAPAAALAKSGITKDKIIIVYCNTGVLSGRFADQLVRRFNFSATKIKNYRGSITDWINSGYKLVTEDHETGYEYYRD